MRLVLAKKLSLSSPPPPPRRHQSTFYTVGQRDSSCGIASQSPREAPGGGARCSLVGRAAAVPLLHRTMYGQPVWLAASEPMERWPAGPSRGAVPTAQHLRRLLCCCRDDLVVLLHSPRRPDCIESCNRSSGSQARRQPRQYGGPGALAPRASHLPPTATPTRQGLARRAFAFAFASSF